MDMPEVGRRLSEIIGRMKRDAVIVHFTPQPDVGKTACGIDAFNAPYHAYYWKDVTCERCLNTVPACHTMFRNKKEGGERK